MPVPSTMADLATLASSNSPAGTEIIGNNADNYFRSHAAIIRSTYAVSSATLASASTVDLASSDGERVVVSGTTTITSFGTGFVGCVREVAFTGVLTLVHSANIFLPGATNVITAVNDTYTFRCTASGQWTMVGASRPSAVGAVAKIGDTMSGPLNITTSGVTAAGLTLTSATGTGFIRQSAGGAQLDIGSQTNEPIVFQVNGSEVARVNTSGQMTIGNGTGATGRFNVSGGRSFFAPASAFEAVGVAYNNTRLTAGQAVYIGASDSATPDTVFVNVGGT